MLRVVPDEEFLHTKINNKDVYVDYGKQIHVGMDEMYEIIHQATYRFFGIDKVYKLVMDQIYKIGRFIAKFEYEYSRICVVSVVRA